MPRQSHAIDSGFGNPFKGCHRLRHLRGRDILALPAERIADPVDEIEISVRVPHHQVARAKPRIARREHIPQNLPLARVLFGIAFEPVRRCERIIDNLPHNLADLARRTRNTKPVRAPYRLFLLDIKPHDFDDEPFFRPFRNPAHRTRS